MPISFAIRNPISDVSLYDLDAGEVNMVQRWASQSKPALMGINFSHIIFFIECLSEPTFILCLFVVMEMQQMTYLMLHALKVAIIYHDMSEL